MRYALIAVMAVLLSVSIVFAQATGAAQRELLTTNSLHRTFLVWKTEQVRRASGELAYVQLVSKVRSRPEIEVVEKPVGTPAPPADWASADFDDSGWVRFRGPMFTRRTRKIEAICLRDKFEVTDPASADVALEMIYRGGAVVYLNGREIARAHLPKGKLSIDTPAEDYPKEAYVDPDGYLLRWVGFGDPEKYGDRFALRARKLELKLPADALHKGVNVLAVELHRAPIDEVMFSGNPRANSRGYTVWSMVSLEKLRLTGGEGATSDRTTDGVHLWNWPTGQSLHTADYAGRFQKLQPVDICTARNGTASGQVVLSSDQPLRSVKAMMGELKGDGGVLPADGVQVRFARLDYTAEGGDERRYPHSGGMEPQLPSGSRRFDGLDEEPPAEVAVDPAGRAAILPIWVTVRAPRDAKAGRYAGVLTVSADGFGPQEVPVTVEVAGWALPDPVDFVTHVGLIQSPDTLALRYGVEPWSEAHWKLIDASFTQLARVGNKVLYLPLLRETYFGNPESMVRWIKRADGGYDHDFSIVEKYVEMAVRRMGKVPVVCAYAWDVNTGSTYMGGGKEMEKTGMPITLLDPKTGERSPANGPKWGEEGIREFWKPVFTKLRAVLARHGVEGSLMVGIAGDRRPGKDAVEDLAAAAPGVPWVVSSHSYPEKLYDQPVAYNSVVWGVSNAPDPAERRVMGWKNPHRVVVFPRYMTPPMGEYLRAFSPLGVYHIAAEGSITAHYAAEGVRGFGRCGADFWPVLEGRRGKEVLCGRYPQTSAWHGGWLHNSTPHVLAEGPNGPESGVRFENMLEGLQEAEARIAIEKVLTDSAARAALGDEPAGRAQELLDQRIRLNLLATDGAGSDLSWAWYVGSGMGRRGLELYEMAGKVAPGSAGE